MVRTARRIGLIKSALVVICEKKVFFVPGSSYVKNFPLSIVLLTICEFVGLFEVFRPVIFIGTLCILNICASAIDNLSVRLNPNVV